MLASLRPANIIINEHSFYQFCFLQSVPAILLSPKRGATRMLLVFGPTNMIEIGTTISTGLDGIALEAQLGHSCLQLVYHHFTAGEMPECT